jgi:hypothetical protein
MALLLGQIVEGVGGTQLAGMNQAHVQLTSYGQSSTGSLMRETFPEWDVPSKYVKISGCP